MRKGEWIATMVAGVSAAAAIASFVVAQNSQSDSEATAKDQKALQARVEERSSAPVLSAGVEPATRGKKVVLHTIVGEVVKPAEVASFFAHKGRPRHLLEVPVWNVGNGLAVWRETKVLPGCGKAFDKEFAKRPTNERRLGFYNVPVGLSEQLGHKIDPGEETRIAATAARRNKLSVYVFYTDLLNDRDRATCIDWKRGKAKNPWRPAGQNYKDDSARRSPNAH